MRYNIDQANSWARGWIATGDGIFPIIAGGDGEGDPKPDDGGGDGDPKNSGGTDDDKSGGKDGKDEEKKFTQTELDALIAREKSKALRGKLDPSELGFESKKELDDFLKTAKEKADSEKDEQTQAIEDAKKEAREEAEKTVLSVANQRLIRAEFKLGFAEHELDSAVVDDAFVVAQTLDIWKDVAVDEDGKVEGLDKTFFEELQKEKPWVKKAEQTTTRTRTGASGAGAGNSGDGGKGKREEQLKKDYPALGGRQKMRGGVRRPVRS